MTQMNLLMKQTQNHREQTCSCQGDGVGEEWIGISRCKQMYTECVNNKVLLNSTGNHIQYPITNHKEKK